VSRQTSQLAGGYLQTLQAFAERDAHVDPSHSRTVQGTREQCEAGGQVATKSTRLEYVGVLLCADEQPLGRKMK
jgi:hypothetical protein